MRVPWTVIRKPLVTEKSMANQQKGVYTFAVAMETNKIEIKHAVEKAYNVKVADVRIMRMKGKPKRMKNMLLEGRRKDVKKAYVKLKEGFRLDII